MQPAPFLNKHDAAFQFCNDPNTFFEGSEKKVHAISRADLDALQLEVLKYRFQDLKDRVQMLHQLSSKQGIDELHTINDAVPLLFEHTMYKSYPPLLLEKNRFSDLNKFMSRLTTFDLSSIDVSGCQSIDEWFEVMDRESELQLSHSSGTTGTMSFLPISKQEMDKHGKLVATMIFADSVSSDDEPLVCVYPYFRRGGNFHLRFNEQIVKHVVGGENNFVAAYPDRMSSDVLYLAAKIRAAKAKGELDRLNVNPILMERLKEFEQLQKEMPGHLDKFFDRVCEELRGKRVYFSGTWNLLHGLAKQGLERGEEGVFAANSIVMSGGGAKGMTPPDNWQEDVRRFIGVDKVNMCYAMSEVQAMHMMCEHGHYHFSPMAIPYLLDPDTSRPLPREGRVTGRAAFFDLAAETRWGGFITGDEITVDWDAYCPCGRQSVFIEGGIERYSEKRGGDDKISCAATENAHKEAMDFLTTF